VLMNIFYPTQSKWFCVWINNLNADDGNKLQSVYKY